MTSNQPQVRADGLQLDEHRPLQERVWSAQRIAWIVFVVLLVLALLGLTGSGGPLSRGTLALEFGEVRHPKVARWEAADQITVTFAPGSGNRSVVLSPEFSEAFQVQTIQPQPASSRLTAAGTVLQFDVSPATSSSATLYITPQRPGIASFGVAVDELDLAPVSILVLP